MSNTINTNRRDMLGRFVSGYGLASSNPRWTGGKVAVACEQCGAVKRRYITRPEQKYYFCNVKCKGVWQSTSDAFRGENNPHWKGGTLLDKAGYRMVYKPGHDRAHQNGYVYEHIVVAEKKFGAPVPPRMQVHHLNGIRTDNRPENLDIVTPEEHEKYTVRKIYQRRIRELENEIKRLHDEER